MSTREHIVVGTALKRDDSIASNLEDLEARVASRLETVLKIRCLLPPLILAGVALGVVGVSQYFVTLNFFVTQNHPELGLSDVHCDQDSQASTHLCTEAAAVNLWWQSAVFAPMSAVVQVIVGPMIGILSDYFGRRPVLAAISALQFLPISCVCLYVWTERSTLMWAGLALRSLQDIPVIAVWFAYITDIVEEQSARTLSIAMAEIILGMSSGIGVIVGAFDSVKGGFAVQFWLCIFVVTYITLILPESLPVGQRSPLNYKAMAPWRSLNILVTNELFMRLTAILLISTFCNAGLANVYAAYRTELVGWSRSDTFHAMVAGLLATLLWLGGFLRMIMPKLGEPGVLALAQLSALAYNFVFPVLMHRNQFMLLEFVLRGPISLALPAISSLKSRLVPQSTQGHLQGAITTVQQVCAGLGPVFWCFIYNEWDYHQWEPWARQIYGHPYFTYYGRAFVFWLACVSSLPSLWLISKLPKNITHRDIEGHLDRQQHLRAPLLEAALDEAQLGQF